MSGLTCENARHLFDAYLNGELSPGLETELNAHRLRCAACRHELALLEVAGRIIATDDPAPPLADSFTERLAACVIEAPARRRVHRWRWMRRGAGLLAAAACLTFTVGHFSRPKPRVAGFSGRPAIVTPQGNAASTAAATTPEQDHASLSRSLDTQAGPGVAQPASFPPFQAQLERALTDWRKDASSLGRVYDFITPRMNAETRLDRPETFHEPPAAFELGQPDTFEAGDAPSRKPNDLKRGVGVRTN